MSPPHFPITPDGLRGRWEFLPGTHGGLPIRDSTVHVSEIAHKGGLTVGVRVELATARQYGHATVEAAMAFADRCPVGRLVLTHHAPGRTNDVLEVSGPKAAMSRSPHEQKSTPAETSAAH